MIISMANALPAITPACLLHQASTYYPAIGTQGGSTIQFFRTRIDELGIVLLSSTYIFESIRTHDSQEQAGSPGIRDQSRPVESPLHQPSESGETCERGTPSPPRPTIATSSERVSGAGSRDQPGTRPRHARSSYRGFACFLSEEYTNPRRAVTDFVEIERWRTILARPFRPCETSGDAPLACRIPAPTPGRMPLRPPPAGARLAPVQAPRNFPLTTPAKNAMFHSIPIDLLNQASVGMIG